MMDNWMVSGYLGDLWSLRRPNYPRQQPFQVLWVASLSVLSTVSTKSCCKDILLIVNWFSGYCLSHCSPFMFTGDMLKVQNRCTDQTKVWDTENPFRSAVLPRQIQYNMNDATINLVPGTSGRLWKDGMGTVEIELPKSSRLTKVFTLNPSFCNYTGSVEQDQLPCGIGHTWADDETSW